MLAVVVSVPVSVTVYVPAATSVEVVPPPLLFVVPELLPHPTIMPIVATSATQPRVVQIFERFFDPRSPKNRNPATAAALSGMVLPSGSPSCAAAFVAPAGRDAKLCTPDAVHALCDVYTVSGPVAAASAATAVLLMA